MTKQHAGAVGMAIATLVEAFGVKEITPVRIKVYEKALGKLPPAILPAMVELTIETRSAKGKDWLPSVHDLLADAEACRLKLLAANPWSACAECEDSPRWRAINDGPYVRLERCPCVARHRERLTALGWTPEPLALPPASTEREMVPVGEIE